MKQPTQAHSHYVTKCRFDRDAGSLLEPRHYAYIMQRLREGNQS